MTRRANLMLGKAAGLASAALVLACLPATAQDWQSVSAILQDRCVTCHSGEFAPLGLQLDSHQSLMSGSENGPVITLDAPDQSALVQRLTGRIEPRMPLDGPPFLSVADIATVTAWIAAGAPGPDVPEIESTPAPVDPYADGAITYDEVAGIFGRHCVVCHSDNGRYDAPPEGLRLSSLETILRGGERLAVLPGNAQASEIIRRVEGLSDPRMPFDGPPWLDDAEVQLLRDWIDGGARSAQGEIAPTPVGQSVRLRGILTDRHEIDGAGFVVTSGTRIDDLPRIGSPAEVRARVGPNGDLIAERFRDR